MPRSLRALLLLLGLTGAASATTWLAPTDFGVMAVRLSDGEKIWETQPGVLTDPRLQIFDGRLRVFDAVGHRYGFDRATGTLDPPGGVLDEREGPPEVGWLDPVELSWGRWSDYRCDKYGGKTLTITRHETVVREIPLVLPIAELASLGGLVFFDLALGSAPLGELVAYDVARDTIAWELDLVAVAPGVLAENTHRLVTDGENLYVAGNQEILALDPLTGGVRWRRSLPREDLGPGMSGRPTLSRHGDRLFANGWSRLSALDARSGALRWWLDVGMFGGFPFVVDGDRVYLPTSRGAVQYMSQTRGRSARTEVPRTALAIRRVGKAYRVSTIPRAEVPAGETLWWSMNPPPVGKGKRRVILRLFDGPDGREMQLDLTAPFATRDVVYVKELPGYGRAEVQ